MKKSRFSESQIIGVLNEAKSGVAVPEVCRRHGISDATSLRCDNGPENISEHLRRWARDRNIDIRYIQPGKPQQNAYIERFNRTVRHEWLNQHLFASIEQAQDLATRWLWTYNAQRPHMALGGITPHQKLAMAA